MTDFTSERRLCDDDGRVSQANVPGEEFLTYLGQHNRLAALTGHPPVYEPFDCTGSAHLAGEHIRCTSPAHLIECECCGYRIVEVKSPGIGYYCTRCLSHWSWSEDLGRPNARHATSVALQQEIAEDHASIGRAYTAGWCFTEGA